jgi:hypothetical protein
MNAFRCSARRAAIVVAVFVALTACSTKLPEPLTSQRLIESPAVVTAIDAPGRRLTVTTDDGARADVMLDPTVKNIDRIRIGDRVVVSYYQGIAAEVKSHERDARVDETAASGVMPGAGERSGASAAPVRTTVTVVSVDHGRNDITVRSADGRTRTLSVVRAEGQQFIAGLREGDQVDIAFTEAVAVGVRPAQ